jgi:hypothetical protein
MGRWRTAADVFRDFHIEQPEDSIVLFAVYGDGDYCGKAFVLCRDEAGLFTVEASHCSCYGLEDSWSPVRVTIASLMHELTQGSLGQACDEQYGPQLLAFLTTLVGDLS